MIMQNSWGGGKIRCIMGDVQMAYAFWLLVQMCYKPRSQGCLLPVATERERRVGENPGNEVDALSLSNRRLVEASAIHVDLR